MGYDAVSYLPAKTSPSRVSRVLVDLGYTRVRATLDRKQGELAYFRYYDRAGYTSYSAIEATLTKGKHDNLELTTHTTVWRSPDDAIKHNQTLRELRQQLGGYFESDNGRDRYLPVPKRRRTPAESGCFLSYWGFTHNIVRARIYLQYRTFPDSVVKPQLQYVQDLSPLMLSNSMLRTFLVGALEDYLKSTYVALLRNSDRQEVVFRSARLTSEDLASISTGRLIVEQAFANSFSFQNINVALKRFQELDPKLQIHAALVKPYRRRKVRLLDALVTLVEQRNKFIHDNELDFRCNETRILADLENVVASVDRIYSAVLTRQGWYDERPL